MVYIRNIEKILIKYKGQFSLHDLVEAYNNMFEEDSTCHYTDDKTIDYMIELAEIKPHESVADYTGGTAKILDRIGNKAGKLLHNDRYYLETLVAKLVLHQYKNNQFYHEDFFTGDFEKVDVIITNIPFLSPSQNTTIMNKIISLCKRAIVIVPTSFNHTLFTEVRNKTKLVFNHTNVSAKILTYKEQSIEAKNTQEILLFG